MKRLLRRLGFLQYFGYPVTFCIALYVAILQDAEPSRAWLYLLAGWVLIATINLRAALKYKKQADTWHKHWEREINRSRWTLPGPIPEDRQ